MSTTNSSKSTPAGKPTAKDTDVSRETSDKVSRETDNKSTVDYPGLKGTEHDQPAGRDNMDERDATIARLQRELAELKAADGPAEMRRAIAALTAEVDRMKSGTGLVPVPTGGEPDPFLYWCRLANGDVIETQNPHATHHYTESHGLVPVSYVWMKDPDHVTDEPLSV